MYPPRRWKRPRLLTDMAQRRSVRVIVLSFVLLLAIVLLRNRTRYHDVATFNTIPELLVDSKAPAPPSTPPSVPPSGLSAVIAAPASASEAQIAATLDSLRLADPHLPCLVHHFGPLPPQSKTSHPDVTHVNSASRRPYENPLRAIHTSVLYVTAGSIVSPAALRWLNAATQAYASRPDVGLFSLASVHVKRNDRRAPDHRPDSWSTVDVPSTAFAYRLLVDGAAFFPNFRKDLAVWDTFTEWLQLRRSDWYKYPTGDGVDHTPLGMSQRPESNWTRAAWNVWFSKFLAEYRLSVVYPNLDAPLVAPFGQQVYQGTEQFRMPELSVFDSTGNPIKEGFFRPNTVRQIVTLGHQQGGMVSFTLVNNVFIDTAHSWLCNVDVSNMRPKGLLWAATDMETKEEMDAVNGSEVILLDEVKGGKETGHDFGNPGYWRLMLERTALIGEILRNGIAVFAFETDAIWLEDPQPYIDELVSQDADIVGTINTRLEVSGNFFYLRPTLATRCLWDEITNRFESAYKEQKFDEKEPDSWTYIENDQSQLTKLVLRNDSWRRSYPLSFLTLDMERFVDGRWYTPEEGFYTSERARNPVVINNNFLIGTDEKTSRAKKWGHWFWDEKNRKCLVDVVEKAITSRNGTLQ